MFAGPNGSGKSTIKNVISDDLLGVYINPDEIEKDIKQCDFLDLRQYEIESTEEEVTSFFKDSALLKKADLLEDADFIGYADKKITFHNVPKDKIISRYKRSLENLFDAIKLTDRAYIFDNSGLEHLWICEITNGEDFEMKQDVIPGWFYSAVIENNEKK